MKLPADWKNDFPVFANNPRLIYLDSAATALKPRSVIDKITEYYAKYPANIHRGIYRISEKATEEYEESRIAVKKFINASRFEEIIFTRNTTESVNLIAYSLGRQMVGPDDEIVTTVMEHHSNFVPWQVLAHETGAIFKVVDINNDGCLDVNISNLAGIITKRTKILALAYVSNVLGTVNPVKEIIRAAKKINPKIITVVDAAQAIPHIPVDVRDLDCDFLAFSGHKMLGPTGIGVLYGKYNLLNNMFPFNFGGGMIKEVTIEKTEFPPPPARFEAGTPAIAEVIGLGEAVKYLQAIGIKNVSQYENELTSVAVKYLTAAFGDNIRILGPKDVGKRVGVIAFTFKNYHPHDIAQILDEDDICIRAGHHCAMPVHKRYGLTASARMSLYLYNDYKDIEKVIAGLKKAEKILK